MNTKQQVAVIDYGMGNLHSVAKALEHVSDGQHDVIVTADASIIQQADRVVFPGVGAIRDCMAEIKRLHIDELVKQAAAEKPVLAVCVGMQALLHSSDENNGVDCIGLLSGEVQRFQPQPGLKIPHMGWNNVQQTSDHSLWHNIDQNSYFYFVHSFCVGDGHPNQAARCVYGQPFSAALQQGNLFATQFHPEKSHDDGLQLYKNFLHWNGDSTC